MPNKVDSKSLVLHGIGEAFMLSSDGTVATRLTKMQSMTIEVSSESEDVYGGDSLFPIFNYIKSKSATFKFKNAVFDMDVLAATQGTVAETGGEINAAEDVTAKAGKAQLSINTGVDVDSVAAVTAAGKVLKRTAAAGNEGEFSVAETGALTFSSDVTDGTVVTVSYVYKVADGTSVHITTTDVPGCVELRHKSMPIKLKDGRTVELHTRVYKAVCDGGISLEYTRDGAVAPEVTFKSVDPERADKRFVTYSLVEVKNQ